MARRPYSLRWRIVGLVGVPVMISGLAIGGLSLYTSWHEIEEVYDAQLIHAAKVLRQLAQHGLEEQGAGSIDLIPEIEDLGYKYEQNISFRIWRDGKPVTRSGNTAVFGDLQAPPGLSDQRINGEEWRFFVFIDTATGVMVETAERYAIRYELIWYLLLGLLLPASLFIPVVLVVVWYGTGRGLRPLAALSRDVDSRDSDDLGSIETNQTPREIEALVKALNGLFRRLKDALDRERDFTDNAAHELRTPLAAIKTQAQALRRRLADIPECRESLSNLLASIDRSTHLVDKLLLFSRLQKEQPQVDIVDLADLLSETVGELAAYAFERRQALSLDADEHLTTRGDRHALGIMMRNLIENAVKYTPAAGTVTVALHSRNGSPVVLVEDNGPGIPEKERERVLRRFYRIDRGGGTGGGLGLAIVKWIADRHGAELQLADVVPSGLRCTIVFPSSAPVQARVQ